jgi:hypothetical protein
VPIAGATTPAAARPAPPTRPARPGTPAAPAASTGQAPTPPASSPPAGPYGGGPVAGNRTPTAYHAPSPAAGVRPPGARPVPPASSPVGGMPAVGHPGQQPPGHAAPGYTSGQHLAGGVPSGGHRSGGLDDRTLLLVAIGLAALLLLVVVGIILSRGGDESGYSDAVRDNFVEGCAGEASRTACECAIDAIAENVPFDEFDAWEQDLAQDASAEAPDAIQDVLTECDVTA